MGQGLPPALLAIFFRWQHKWQVYPKRPHLCIRIVNRACTIRVSTFFSRIQPVTRHTSRARRKPLRLYCHRALGNTTCICADPSANELQSENAPNFYFGSSSVLYYSPARQPNRSKSQSERQYPRASASAEYSARSRI